MQEPPISSSPSNEPTAREASQPGAGGPKGHDERTPEPTETLRGAAEWVGKKLEQPGVGAAAAGGALVVAAVVAGLPEALVGAGGAYLVYRLLRKRSRPSR